MPTICKRIALDTQILSVSFEEPCQQRIPPARREITDAYCRSEHRLRVSHGSSFRLYSSFESLSRRQSFQPSGETIVRVHSSTARFTLRRRASLVPFFIFVRFGAHSMKTFSEAVVSSRINGNRLLPAHWGCFGWPSKSSSVGTKSM